MFFHSITIFAGPGRSGGGNSVICFNDPKIAQRMGDPTSDSFEQILDRDIGKISFIETLDLSVARQAFVGDQENKIFEIRNLESPYDYVRRLAKRFENSLPMISQILTKGLSNIPRERTVLRSDKGIAQLKRIDDENDLGYLRNKKNCVIATVAEQYEVNGLYFVELDARIYNHPKNSALSKAILLLHEAVYTVFRGQGDRDSRNTRNFIRAIISKDQKSEKLVQLLRALFPKWGTTDLTTLSQIGSRLARTLLQLTNAILNEEIRNAMQDQAINREIHQLFMDWHQKHYFQRRVLPGQQFSSQWSGPIQSIFETIGNMIRIQPIQSPNNDFSRPSPPNYLDFAASSCPESQNGDFLHEPCITKLAELLLLAANRYATSAKDQARGRFLEIYNIEFSRIRAQELQLFESAIVDQFERVILEFIESYIDKSIKLYFFEMADFLWRLRPEISNRTALIPPTIENLRDEIEKISIQISE